MGNTNPNDSGKTRSKADAAKDRCTDHNQPPAECLECNPIQKPNAPEGTN